MSAGRTSVGRERLLISACLLGAACRYDGGTKPMAADILASLADKYELIPVCPEQLGGLPTPRNPSERLGERVVMVSGEDVTENYRRGASQALYLARLFGCARALLKERSPSCGSGSVYDGSFSGTLRPGDGVCAEELKKAGIDVYGESRVRELL